MKKRKTTANVKQIVKIRLKPLASGGKSIYLETYCKGVRSYEFLRMYLCPERTVEDREQNRHTLQVAETLRADRQKEFLCRQAGLPLPRYTRMTLREFLTHYCAEQQKRGCRSLKTLQHVCRLASECMGEIRMRDIGKEHYHEFNNFLRHSYKTNARCREGHIAASSRYQYLSLLNAVLNAAVRNEIIHENPFSKIARCDRIQRTEHQQEYLNIDELKRLIKTPMPIRQRNDVRRAYLFCCFSGLRFSDVSALRWEHIVRNTTQVWIEMRMRKTQRIISMPLSEEALKWLPEENKKNRNQPIFPLPDLHTVEDNLQRWAVAAGIHKHITFHSSRHTFATMMLTLGADLYTTSKLLGHTSVRTTQIYARVIDKRKEEAVNLANGLF